MFLKVHLDTSRSLSSAFFHFYQIGPLQKPGYEVIATKFEVTSCIVHRIEYAMLIYLKSDQTFF